MWFFLGCGLFSCLIKMKAMALFVGITHWDFIFYSYLSPIFILTYHSLVPFSSSVYFIHNEYLCFGIIFPKTNRYISLHFFSVKSLLYIVKALGCCFPFLSFHHMQCFSIQYHQHRSLISSCSQITRTWMQSDSEKALNKKSLLCWVISWMYVWLDYFLNEIRADFQIQIMRRWYSEDCPICICPLKFILFFILFWQSHGTCFWLLGLGRAKNEWNWLERKVGDESRCVLTSVHFMAKATNMTKLDINGMWEV